MLFYLFDNLVVNRHNYHCFRISTLETTLKTLMLTISSLKTTARSRADAHERLHANIDASKETIEGQKALFENFALLAKREDGPKGKGKSTSYWKMRKNITEFVMILSINLCYLVHFSGITKGIENINERIHVLDGVESALNDELLERSLLQLKTEAVEVDICIV